MKASITVHGKVWAMGAKAGYDPLLGSYLRFVVKVPTARKHTPTKLWVDWYSAIGWPNPGDWVTMSGNLGMSMLRETAGGKDRGEVYLECRGADGVIESSSAGPRQGASAP